MAGFTSQLLTACSANAQDIIRFSQTGIGWVLRELSKSQPQAVRMFVDSHQLSREAQNMAMAKITGQGGSRR